VLCRCVWSTNHKNPREWGGGQGPLGGYRAKRKNQLMSRSEWPRGLRRRSAAARLLGLWIWIPPAAWKSVSCECCVLPGRCLCVGLITCPKESYRVWCVQCVWWRRSVREAMIRNRAEAPDMNSLAESAWKKGPERNRRTLPFQYDWSVTWYWRIGYPPPPKAAMFVTFITVRICSTENNELWGSRLCNCPHPYSLDIQGLWNKVCELLLH